MRTVLAVLVLLGIAAPTTVAQVDSVKPDETALAKANRGKMIGRWFGDTPTKDGGRKMEIVDRYADGTMKITFRVVEPSGEVWDQIELAFWGISGPVYFTMTKGWLEGRRFTPADSTQAYFYDAYEVLELLEESFAYRHFATGSEYRVTKVEPDFDFPL